MKSSISIAAYAPVSTDAHTLDLQRDGLKRGKCREIYEEQASRKNIGGRKSLRQGDTLIVWRLDQLGHSLAGLVRLIVGPEHPKIIFASLTEKIEDGSPAGRLILHVFAARFCMARSTLH